MKFLPLSLLVVASAGSIPHPIPHLTSTSTATPCGTTTSVCPSPSDCCASQYSPSHFGCLVNAGSVTNASVGCGDGLTVDANNNVCCKMGPELAPSTTLPNVLVIGDSVSIGYTTLAPENLVKTLKDDAQVQHGPWDVSDGGAGDTAMGLLCLDQWLKTNSNTEVNWDLITFNFGLHDMTNSTYCEDLYHQQLAQITQKLVNLKTKLLYITTTPFMPRRLLNNTVVEDMNAIAKAIMASHSIPVLDLYAEVVSKCGEVYTNCSICRVEPCSFHYNDIGESQQAAVIAAQVKKMLA